MRTLLVWYVLAVLGLWVWFVRDVISLKHPVPRVQEQKSGQCARINRTQETEERFFAPFPATGSTQELVRLRLRGRPYRQRMQLLVEDVQQHSSVDFPAVQKETESRRRAELTCY